MSINFCLQWASHSLIIALAIGDNIKQPLSSSSLHSLSVKTSNSLTLRCLFNACRPERLISTLDRYRHVNAMYSVHWGRWSRNLLIIWQHLPQGENELYSCTLTTLLKAKITSRSCKQICVMAKIWCYMQDWIQEVPAILHDNFGRDSHEPYFHLTRVACLQLLWQKRKTGTLHYSECRNTLIQAHATSRTRLTRDINADSTWA